MATLSQHIAARNDDDLAERLVAAAEQAGIPQPEQWVEQHRGRLVSVPIGGENLADVHAYAVATYSPPPRPGANPAAVTDALIAQAVDAVFNPPTV